MKRASRMNFAKVAVAAFILLAIVASMAVFTNESTTTALNAIDSPTREAVEVAACPEPSQWSAGPAAPSTGGSTWGVGPAAPSTSSGSTWGANASPC